MRQTTKIALTWEIFGQETPKIHIAEHVGVNRRTIHRWISGIEEKGDLESFIDAYLIAKKGPREKRKVDGLLKKLQGDKANAFGDVLRMLDFLLAFRYEEFDTSELDAIEAFIYSAKEHPFQIKERVNAIRVRQITQSKKEGEG